MKSALLCVLLLSATTYLCGQAQEQASDHIVVVGNPAQPVMWNHRATIQQAITHAQPYGNVVIPADYQGTDCNPISSCNPGNVVIIDWRTSAGVGNYLPLSGGTLTGPLIVPSFTLTGAGTGCASFTAGVLSGTGTACGSGGGGSGTVGTGTAGQFAVYTGGTAVAGDSNLTDNSGLLAYIGVNGINMSGPWTCSGCAFQISSSVAPSSDLSVGSNFMAFGARPTANDSTMSPWWANSNGMYEVASTQVGYGGTVTYTSTATGTAASDNGKLVVMNCSSACSYTPGVPWPNSQWKIVIMSVGSTNATMTFVNGVNELNGGGATLTLTPYVPLALFADSSNNIDYLSPGLLVAGAGVSLTGTSYGGLTIAATGVVSLTGDSVLYINSASTGVVTLTPNSAVTGYTVYGNTSGTAGTASFTSNPNVLSVVLHGSSSGSKTINVDSTGSKIQLGSTAATVDGSGNLVVNACTGCSATTSTPILALTSGGGNISASSATYQGIANSGTTENVAKVPIARSGTLKNLSCYDAATLTGTMQVVFTVRQNGASPGSGLTCTINSSSSVCTDAVDSIAVSANDLIDLQSAPTNSPTAGAVNCSMTYQ